ncbi:MAG: rRNA maturation RNase YbeY [Acidobacteria bacterium]|jgi:probable rRNA maturation factor|nr:MAG: rRNA maturation RNase YbeY [Acidobacteriota bacterium]GIU82431.1 MAG: endoribonuclease YbeY [Pyrinomonadaceae bacterium]
MPEVINKQRKIKLEKSRFEKFAKEASNLIEQAKDKDFTIVFVSDQKIKKLNKTFRNKNLPTDVLSFGYEADPSEPKNDFLGDIVISLETAKRQAKENGLSLEKEIKQLILHGILHLCGYNHETDSGQMNQLELELRKKLNID